MKYEKKRNIYIDKIFINLRVFFCFTIEKTKKMCNTTILESKHETTKPC